MQDSISIASESDEETASLEATVSHLSSTIDSLSNESIADVMEDDLSDLPSSSSPSPSTNENAHLNLSLFEGAIEGLYQHAHSVLEQAKESILLQKREEYEVLETEYATLLRGKQNELDEAVSQLEQVTTTHTSLEGHWQKSRSLALRILLRSRREREASSALASAFFRWRSAAVEHKQEVLLDRVSASIRASKLKMKAWHRMKRRSGILQQSRQQAAFESRLEEETTQLRTSYEEELEALRSKVVCLEEAVEEERSRREETEEKMRHSFLQGIAAVNMQAMELFQSMKEPVASPGREGGLPSFLQSLVKESEQMAQKTSRPSSLPLSTLSLRTDYGVESNLHSEEEEEDEEEDEGEDEEEEDQKASSSMSIPRINVQGLAMPETLSTTPVPQPKTLHRKPTPREDAFRGISIPRVGLQGFQDASGDMYGHYEQEEEESKKARRGHPMKKRRGSAKTALSQPTWK
jgi:hypothetical protein